jgi:hypothetical protein
MNTELHEIEKQLILYTKGHFKRINYDEDLKHFAAKLYGLNTETVELYSIINMVIDTYQALVDLGYINFKIDKFLSDTFRRAWRDESKREVNWNTVLKEMLAEVSCMQVNFEEQSKSLNLGKVDLTIIPEIAV